MFVKNIDTVSNTYAGQLIEAGAFYEIQSHEEDSFAKDNLLISHIGQDKAQMSDSGVDAGLIGSYSDQVDALKSIRRIVQDTHPVVSQDIYKTKWSGANCVFTQKVETHIYVAIPFTYIRGGRFEIENHIFSEDDYDLQIVIKGATPAQDTIIDDYLTNIPVRKDGCVEIKSSNISNAIPAGLHMRASYRSSANATVDVKGALELYGKNDV